LGDGQDNTEGSPKKGPTIQWTAKKKKGKKVKKLGKKKDSAVGPFSNV